MSFRGAVAIAVCFFASACSKSEPRVQVPAAPINSDAAPDTEAAQGATVTANAAGGPFASLALKPGMTREDAEKAIAASLGKETTYSPYGNNLRGGTVVYTDASGKYHLEVVYKAGAPAPWVSQPDGGAVHYPPMDETILSVRTFTR